MEQGPELDGIWAGGNQLTRRAIRDPAKAWTRTA